MKCPKCDHPLSEVYLREVPIEQCSSCQGIWLDSGEFELIAEREKAEEGWLSKAFKNLLGGLRKTEEQASPKAIVPPSTPPSQPEI